MTNIYIEIDPYSNKISMKIDDVFIDSNSKFYIQVENEDFRLWIDEYSSGKTIWRGFLRELLEETNDINFNFTFKMGNSDFNFFKNSIENERDTLNQEGTLVNLEFKQVKLDNYESYHELMKDNVFKIVVVGKYNSGKSSLINALLGVKVLPVKVTPVTSVITEIKYGENMKIIVYPKDGKFHEINYIDLERYISSNDIEKSTLEKIEIYLPCKILEFGLVFIDTPGFSYEDGLNPKIYDYLLEADLIIYTISSLMALSKVDRKFINKINSLNFRNIIFALTFFDLIKDEPEQVSEFVEIVKNRLAEFTVLKEKGVQFVSSFEALKCKEKGNLQLGQLEKVMEEYLIKAVKL